MERHVFCVVWEWNFETLFRLISAFKGLKTLSDNNVTINATDYGIGLRMGSTLFPWSFRLSYLFQCKLSFLPSIWRLNIRGHLKFMYEAQNWTMPNRTMQSQTKAYITNCRQKTTTKGKWYDLFLGFCPFAQFFKEMRSFGLAVSVFRQRST